MKDMVFGLIFNLFPSYNRCWTVVIRVSTFKTSSFVWQVILTIPFIIKKMILMKKWKMQVIFKSGENRSTLFRVYISTVVSLGTVKSLSKYTIDINWWYIVGIDWGLTAKWELFLLNWVECGNLALSVVRNSKRNKIEKMVVSKSDVKSFVKANFLQYNITVTDKHSNNSEN